MPIVDNNGNVRIEYTIPENIKNLITDAFLKEFRNQLFRMHIYYSLEEFADSGIPINTSTCGWFAAFGKACLLTNNEQLLDYWRVLPWYDSDIFDSELANMLVEKKLILGNIADVLSSQLGINIDDIVVCSDCGRIYTKDMVVEIKDNDDISYRCLYCQDSKNTKTDNPNVTDYYREVLKELDDYKNNHPITNEEM